jgi:hypothetical protein
MTLVAEWFSTENLTSLMHDSDAFEDTENNGTSKKATYTLSQD